MAIDKREDESAFYPGGKTIPRGQAGESGLIPPEGFEAVKRDAAAGAKHAEKKGNPHETRFADLPDKPEIPSLEGLATEERLNAAVATERTRAEAAEKDLSDRIARIKTMTKRVVDALPAVGEEDVLYLVPSTTSAAQNVRDEYLWINGAWELIGSTAVDLSGYAKKSDLEGVVKTSDQDYRALRTNALIGSGHALTKQPNPHGVTGADIPVSADDPTKVDKILGDVKNKRDKLDLKTYKKGYGEWTLPQDRIDAGYYLDDQDVEHGWASCYQKHSISDKYVGEVYYDEENPTVGWVENNGRVLIEGITRKEIPVEDGGNLATKKDLATAGEKFVVRPDIERGDRKWAEDEWSDGSVLSYSGANIGGSDGAVFSARLEYNGDYDDEGEDWSLGRKLSRFKIVHPGKIIRGDAYIVPEYTDWINISDFVDGKYEFDLIDNEYSSLWASKPTIQWPGGEESKRYTNLHVICEIVGNNLEVRAYYNIPGWGVRDADYCLAGGFVAKMWESGTFNPRRIEEIINSRTVKRNIEIIASQVAPQAMPKWSDITDKPAMTIEGTTDAAAATAKKITLDKTTAVIPAVVTPASDMALGKAADAKSLWDKLGAFWKEGSKVEFLLDNSLMVPGIAIYSEFEKDFYHFKATDKGLEIVYPEGYSIVIPTINSRETFALVSQLSGITAQDIGDFKHYKGELEQLTSPYEPEWTNGDIVYSIADNDYFQKAGTWEEYPATDGFKKLVELCSKNKALILSDTAFSEKVQEIVNGMFDNADTTSYGGQN